MAHKALRLVREDGTKEPVKVHFTVKMLDMLTAGEKRRWVYDSDTKHLAMMLTPAGGKRFYWCGRIKGRFERVLIGDFPEVTIDNARDIAATHTGEVAKGNNPADTRRQARGENTLRELWDTYCKDYAAVHCTEKTRRADASLWKVAVSSLGSRRLSAIEQAHVSKMHRVIAGNRGNTTANRAVQMVRRLFNYADAEIGYRGENPAARVKLFPEQSRERYLTPEELPRFFKALEKEPEQYRDFFKLCIFTGARRSNIQAMKWSDVDLVRSLWTIPGDESKNKKPMTIPIVPEAVEILTRRLAANQKRKPPSLYVFPATKRRVRLHMGQPLKPWERIIQRAELPDLRIHDLRRTMGTYQALGGASLLTIGKSLGHRDSRSTAIYARLADDAAKKSMSSAAAAMLATLKVKPGKGRKAKGKEQTGEGRSPA